PRRRAVGRVPRGAAVGGGLDPRDHAVGVGGRAGDGDRPAVVHDGVVGGGADDRGRRRRVGGRRRGGPAAHQGRRLGAHVREQVDGRLLHGRVLGRLR